jgi:hypothetical protein
LVELSRLVYDLGEYEIAEQHAQDVVKIASETGQTSIALEAASLLAFIAARQGAPERALTMAAYVLQHPTCSRETRAQMESLRGELAALLGNEQWEKMQKAAQSASFEEVDETSP